MSSRKRRRPASYGSYLSRQTRRITKRQSQGVSAVVIVVYRSREVGPCDGLGCVIEQVIQPDRVLVLGYCSRFGRVEPLDQAPKRSCLSLAGRGQQRVNAELALAADEMNSTLRGGLPKAAPVEFADPTLTRAFHPSSIT